MCLYCFWHIYSTIYLRWRGDENVAIKMFANPLYVSSHLPCLPVMAQRTLPLFCYSKWRDFISILSSYVRIPTAINAPARVISTTGDNPWAAYRIINFTTNFAFILFENKLNTHILDVNWGCRLFLANVNIIATTPDWKFDSKSLRYLAYLNNYLGNSFLPYLTYLDLTVSMTYYHWIAMSTCNIAEVICFILIWG